MIPANVLAALANHLWQSTLFAAAVGLLTLALRKNHAQARHWLWLAASAKFLIPFSLLVALGSQLGWRTAPALPKAGLTSVVQEISQPFSQPQPHIVFRTHTRSTFPIVSAVILGAWICGLAAVLLSWLISWRRITATVRQAVPLSEGRERNALRRLQRISGIGYRIQLLASTTRLEPGVFGIRRPVLLLPAGIANRLDDEQLESIIAHELCHVRRRDNLASAFHMVVQAIFWFHPLVWWLGAKLVDERERACDEDVLRLGNPPQVYAEGILKVCEFYLESPIVCVAGVSGANLKKRIEEIMNHRIANKLDFGRKLLLATIGAAAVAGPILIGLLNAPQSRAQSAAAPTKPLSFEVASIKPSAPGGRGIRIEFDPGGRFKGQNVTVKFLMQQAFGIRDFQITGGPSWIGSERYDIEAKPESDVNPSQEQNRLMFQSLLADRFKLTFHRETKELPVYYLVVGKNGSKLTASEGGRDNAQIRMGRGQINAQGMSMEMFTNQLANQLGRSVLDKTGLTGNYDFKLEWTPDQSQAGGPGPGDGGGDHPPASDPNGPSIFTAVQEQLGLKLESQKGPVQILVIDRIEKASDN